MDVLYLKDLLSYFGKNDFVHSLIEFVENKLEKKPENIKYKYILGQKEWIENIKRKYKNFKINLEIDDHKALLSKNINVELLKSLIKHNDEKYFSILFYLFDKYTEITQEKIASKYGYKCRSTISKKICKIKIKIRDDSNFKKYLMELENKVIY